jgi:3-oxoacyl-[acyl-carrier protein] reductase
VSGELAGRAAIVTGAGAAMGRGIARALAGAGASIVIAARRAETGEPSAQGIRDSGGAAICVEADVTRRADVDASVTAAIDNYGRLDIVVHNAVSGQEYARVEDLTATGWREQAAVATKGTLHCAQAAFPHLRERRGRFIVLTSAAGYSGSMALPVYAAIKGAQRTLVKSLAWEWGPFGITVNAIAPIALTEGIQRYFESDPGARESLVSRIAMGYVGDPEHDIGRAAVYLSGDDAAYVTGQTIMVDGGSYLGA